MTKNKLKTLKEIYLEIAKNKTDIHSGFMQQKIRKEAIKWIKQARESWETNSHEDNSHFVIAMWTEFMGIEEEDLKDE